ncbi:23S rRNA (adenine(1618)-N(6))-methyltransferase RlmF [Desertivirga xinjiangensis]|uniref:23S rRNA (adenine(1618)-N(6))-methyltransferase RlmF n=1 Tax=Desertivirga xinjiangensis TaxID=539206 RepID=UPI002108F97E|nr:23S rRNA (adenine(1618)-N(6))-methyltransferase RlmF [Pedobacter xinjiangensis]
MVLKKREDTSREHKPQMEEKSALHPRNKHRLGYDFKALSEVCQGLEAFVHLNQYQRETIDFANPDAVKMLNKALLLQFYGVSEWDLPPGYLCPPIPGRADYIHYAADLLASANAQIIPEGKKIKVLDIGTGANCIYPIIGSMEYGWSFIGSDIDKKAIDWARRIIASTTRLGKVVELRHQKSSSDIFKGIIKLHDYFDLSICNPPFHASMQDAISGTMRKQKNLGLDKKTPVLNFGGQKAELWYPGGEIAFVRKMIEQSAEIPQNCYWFTTLVSKKENLRHIYSLLRHLKAFDVRTITMSQGQKTSRVVAWTFLDEEQQVMWKKRRWS